MTDLINLDIAGINLTATCRKPIILQEPDPTYQSFFRKVNKDPGAIDIKIHLELGNIPDTEKLTKIFDSGQSWSMFLNGNDYSLVLNPPAFNNQALWLARINRDFTRVTVYCSEKLLSDRNGKVMLSNPIRYPLDQLLVMYILSQREGALIHAAGIDINGRGIIFPGKSGAGKSTLSLQLAARKGLNNLLSDDRIVVRKINGDFKAFGTPWPGEAGIALNKSVPLSSILFISHGTANRIEELKPQEAIEKLLPVTSIPWYDRETMPKILSFCEDLISRVTSYELCFKPSAEVAKVLEEFAST